MGVCKSNQKVMYFVQANYGSSTQPAASYGGPSPGIGGPAGASYHSNYQQYSYDSYYQQPPLPMPPYSGVSPTVKYLSVVSQSYITTDSQSASLSWCQAPIWVPRPIFILISLIIFRQLWVCLCGAPSLTRGWVCSFQLLLGIGLSPTGLMSIIFLSFIERERRESWVMW
jgi:hypothetical protein